MNLNEQQTFWDDFAQEYTEIQAETVTKIGEDVAHFLAETALFPVTSFVDLAGGSGKYVPYLRSFCQDYYLIDFSNEMLQIASTQFKGEDIKYWQVDQQAFFEQASPASYDFIFTAMNPALQTKADLDQLVRIATKGVAILRLTSDSDVLFSPWEEGVDDSLMAQYKNWLDVDFESKLFTYTMVEEIERSFFENYFEGELQQELMIQLLQKYFSHSNTYQNKRTITFELLLVKTYKSRGINEDY